MRLKYICLITTLFITLPVFANRYEAENFTDITDALTSARTLPNEFHSININDNIQFDSAIREALNFELVGSNRKSNYNFDINGFTLEVLGSDKSSKLSNLNILATSTSSGIISRNSYLTINNSTLLGHTNFGKELVKNTAGSLLVNESNFLNNRTDKGAGINFSGTNLNIDKSNFSGNQSNTGGVIYLDKGSSTISNSTLNNNISTSGGGALYTNQGTTTILDNTVFDENSVSTGSTGSAIYNNRTLTIKNGSKFTNNKVLLGSGGAISNRGTLNIDSAIFENNSTKNDGGAIADTGSTTITNSLFRNNSSAEYLGGAISATTNSRTNISSGAQFVGNKADGLGGGIYSQGTINITANNQNKDVIFSGNQDSNESNAIHLDIYTNEPVGIGTLNVDVSNGSKVVFEDNLSGVKNTVVNMTGTSSYNDKVYLGSANDNLKSNVSLKNISLEFYNQNSGMQNTTITAENTHFNFMNGFISQNKLNLNLIGDNNSFSIDVDPANFTSDYFDFNNNRSAMNNLIIRDINVLSEPTQSSTTFDIFDHERYGTNLTLSESLKNKTVYGA